MNRKNYDFGVFYNYDTDNPNSLITDDSSVIYGTDENGNQICYSAGENITLENGKISSTGGGTEVSVNDVQIDGRTILDEKIANINIGSNLMFDESSNTLSVENIGHVDDIKINSNTILAGRVANINLGSNLSFDESSNTLNVENTGNVDDIKINGNSILNEKIANINLGTNLSFDESTNTLNAQGGEYTEEHVTIQLSVSEGVVDFTGRKITVVYDKIEHQYELDSNGECEFNVTVGVYYTVIYPSILYYSNIDSNIFVATKRDRTIIKIYQYLGNQIRGAVLEQSNPTQWTTFGDEQVVNSILGTYGTYVIDEENKKYAKLDPTDHTYFEDGSVWDGSYGNSFRRIPEVFYLVGKDDNNNHTLQISSQDIGGHSWPEAWIGTYKGSISGNKLRSVPGATTTQSMTMTAFWNAAQGNGINYGLVNYFNHCMLLALHYTKFGTSQSETTMGQGLQNAGSGYYTHITGYCKGLGDGTGSSSYGGSPTLTMNKLFGIEDLAGSTWEFRPNIRFSGSGSIATVYEGNIVSNTASGRTFQKLSSASQAYITKMALGEYCDFIPTAVGGTNATYYCDGTWASSGGELFLVGGCSNDGSLCGLSASFSYYAFSYSGAVIGARLAFCGDISQYTLVSGTELNSLHNL